jgi:hypothetical protein
MADAADMPFGTSLIDVGGTAATIQCQVAEGNNDASAGVATLRILYFLD